MRRAILAIAGVGFFASQASATLLFYDGFDYTAGAKLVERNDTVGTPNPGQLNVDSGFNWRYAGGGGVTNEAPGVGGGSLPAPAGLPASTGNSVQFDMTMIGATRIQVAPAAITSGTVYWSGLIRVNDVNTLTTGVNGMFLSGFNNAAGPGGLPTVGGAILRIRQDTAVNPDGNHYQIGTGLSTNTAAGANGNTVQFASTSFAEGDTVFVVASYEFVAGATNDIARMWVNPNPVDFGAGTPPAATLTSSPGAAIADPFTQLLSYQLRNVNTVGNPNVQFDELRVGDTWADVTPEPGSLALVGVAGIGLLARRRGK